MGMTPKNAQMWISTEAADTSHAYMTISKLDVIQIGDLCSDTRSSLPISNTWNSVLVLRVWPWNFIRSQGNDLLNAGPKTVAAAQYRPCKTLCLEAATSWSKLYSYTCHSN